VLVNPLQKDLDFIFESTKDLFDELNGANIFVTGGTGFFGCWLLESFLWIRNKLGLNCKMHVLTRNPDAFKSKAPHLAADKGVSFYAGDVMDFPFLPGKFDYIIHAATEASAKLTQEKPQLMHDTIVAGTKHVLEFAKHCGTRKLLFTSSGAVYGRQPPEISHIDEEYAGEYTDIEGKSPYGLGKKIAEEICIKATQENNFEVKIARCFAFVGPYLPLDIHFAIGNFILAGLRHEPIIINGDGTPYRSYLYAADLMVWLWHILLRGENCRPYNVGSEDAINIVDLAGTVAKHFIPAPQINVLKKAVAKKQAERYVPSTKRACEELGLRQMVSLDEAIERTKEWNLYKIKRGKLC